MEQQSSTRSKDADRSPRVTGRRFIALDAMRGIAAISVMMFHYLLGSPYHIFEHGFYAVDFFFVLSGVVLTHSYATKIQNHMRFVHYLKVRMIRLYPFYAIGSILGVVSLLSYMTSSSIMGFRRVDYVLSMIFGAVFLPYPNNGAIPFVADWTMSGPLFPLDIPAWSLFFEIMASIALFLVIRRRIDPRYVVGFSFIALVGVLSHYRTLNVGYSLDTLLAGFPRTAFWFFFGVVMYQIFISPRSLRIVPDPRTILAITAIMFIIPTSQLAIRFASGAVICTVLIPALVFFGLSVDDQAERKSVFVWLGKISYGVYAIHFPMYQLVIFILAGTSLAGAVKQAPMLTACLLGCFVILIAHLLTAFFDEPLRRWLNGIPAREPG